MSDVTMADLIWEPNDYGEAIAFYEMGRLDPKLHLNDDLAEKLIQIAMFGLTEYREALHLADVLNADFRERERADDE